MTGGRIVVGLDGSQESEDALRWAVEAARCRKASVDAVHVWRYPVGVYGGGLVPPPYIARDSLIAEAQETLDRTCDAVPSDDVEVRRHLEEGPAARCLLDLAKDAVMLVVGSRGRGGFAGLLLGSVSQQLAQHSTCPVVIVK